jgi:hypothetical protein
VVHIRPPAVGRSLATAVTSAVGKVAGDGATRSRSRVIFTPPFTATDRCTSPVAVTVALRGRLRPGRLRIQTRVVGTGRGRDVDRVTLICDPAG